MDEAGIAEKGLKDRKLAGIVADHKSWFFSEKGATGSVIDFRVAVDGALQPVPEGVSRTVLEQDYQHMIDNRLLLDVPDTFDQWMRRCAEIETRAISRLEFSLELPAWPISAYWCAPH
ncbi:hypothetical protein GGD67_002975 [Bradyrhizobium sp. IAR9]|uniref:hypothetical protein n=1 Tax=Bradyrhizobium sp. IAR9 TaxID=2663841 RepID=UPI00179DC773|nr:hypothetical protein [Bradyrhizobium sp. IAR9]